MDERVSFFKLADHAAATAPQPSAVASPALAAAAPRRPRAMAEQRPAAKRQAAASAPRRNEIWDGEWALIGSKA